MPKDNALQTITTVDHLPEKFEDQLTVYTPQIKAALPSHIPVDRFKRVLITAVNQQPDLVKADRRSLFNACVKAANDGLYPDGREAALVIFNKKNKDTGQWDQAVQYMPMIAGVRKRMRNSGEVKSSEAHVIYEKDQFSYELGDSPKILHRPLVLGDRGKPIGAYAVINLTNGEVLREVMSFAEIEQARAVSRAKDSGPWVTWWGEMARKTVLRRCAKAAPMSADLDDLMKRDDEIEPDGTPMLDAGGMTGRPTREIEHAKPMPSQQTPTHDAETGEMRGDAGDPPADAKTDADTYDLVDATGQPESKHQTAEDWAKHFAGVIGTATTKKEISYMLANGDAWLLIRDEVEDDRLVNKIDGLFDRLQREADLAQRGKEAVAARAAARAEAAAAAQTPPAVASAPAVIAGSIALTMKPDGKPDSAAYLVASQSAVKAMTDGAAVVAFVVREVENLKLVLPGTKRAVVNNVAQAHWISLGGKQEEWEGVLRAAVNAGAA